MSCIDGALIRNLHTVPVNAGDGLWRAFEEGAWTTTNKLWCFRFDEAENVALYGGTSCTGWYVETGSGETRPCIVGADGCTVLAPMSCAWAHAKQLAGLRTGS